MDVANSLRVFVRTVETGSLSQAARDLGLAQPAASKLLRKMEEHCGASLFHRSRRGMAPTAAGRRLHALCGDALATIDEALATVRAEGDEISGNVRIHSPACLGERHLHRIAESFRDRHRTVSVDLILGNAGVDLADERIDLAFGLRRATQADVQERRIGIARRVLVASPDYLARRGAPGTPAELTAHDVAVTDASLSADGGLSMIGPNGPETVTLDPVLRTNSVQILMGAALSGRAIATAQVLLVSDELADGRLVRVMPEHRVTPTDIRMSYLSRRFLRPAVRAFADFAAPRILAIEGVDRG
ncbi:LysR family transcriptional regulator [Methylopila henanensis]|uniref:LysR family transcriptional regulator n=1 Tax=Methylopila henanensis TaxID=873516 RepID=A0ABW4K5J8_9HYPH